MKNAFKNRYLYSFLLFIIIIVVTEIIIENKNDAAIIDSKKWVDHTYLVLDESKTILPLIKDIQSNGRAYVLAGKPGFLTSIDSAVNIVFNRLGRLSILTRDNLSQQQSLDSLYKLVNKRIEFSRLYISIRDTEGIMPASQLISKGTGIEHTQKISDLIDRIQHEETLLLNIHKNTNSNSIKYLKTFFYTLCITILIIVFILLVFVKSNARLQKQIMVKASEIEKKAKKFEMLLENSFEGIVLMDKNINYIYKGKSAENVTGYSMEERNAKKSIEDLHPDDRLKFEQTLKNILLAHGESVQLLYRVLHKEGHYVWVEAIITNRLKDENVGALVFNIRDVSVKKNIEQQKDDFLAMVSHELKTPVTTLNVLGHILQENFLGKKDKENSMMVNKMVEQTNKLTRLITDLIELDRSGSNKLIFDNKLFRFDQTISEVISDLQQINPTYKIRYNSFPAIEIFGDKDRIVQLLTNLILNAIKYSPLSKEIIVALYRKDNDIICSIKDYGIGIEADETKKIFERFYRSKQNNIKTFPGLGIGLFISTQIVKAHSGDIWVESSPGEGSIFYFSLPLLTV